MRRSKALDLEAYRTGTGFKVFSMLRPVKDIGTPMTISRGNLTLIPGEQITWHGRGGVTVLTGPFKLNETAAKFPFGGNFSKYLLSTANNDYELMMPRFDLDLVRLALGIETE